MWNKRKIIIQNRNIFVCIFIMFVSIGYWYVKPNPDKSINEYIKICKSRFGVNEDDYCKCSAYSIRGIIGDELFMKFVKYRKEDKIKANSIIEKAEKSEKVEKSLNKCFETMTFEGRKNLAKYMIANYHKTGNVGKYFLWDGFEKVDLSCLNEAIDSNGLPEQVSEILYGNSVQKVNAIHLLGIYCISKREAHSELYPKEN